MMTVYEKKLCIIILTDSLIFDLCKDEWIRLNSVFGRSEACSLFVKYLSNHFDDLICKGVRTCVWSLGFDFFKELDFFEIADYVIDFF